MLLEALAKRPVGRLVCASSMSIYGEGLARRTNGEIVAPESDKFTALHYAFFNAGVVVCVPRGTVVEEPIWLTYNVREAALVHTLIIADDGSDVSLIEDYQGASGLACGVVEQVVGANAHLRYVHLQRWAEDVWNFSTQRAQLAGDASLRSERLQAGQGSNDDEQDDRDG